MTNLGEISSRVLRERDEGTLICQAPDGESFHQDRGSVAVHVVSGWCCTAGCDFVRQIEVGR